MRPSGRAANELRAVRLQINFSKYAEGSCLAKFGDTHVLCTASIEDSVPPFLRNSGRGWVTAEYGMLPRATNIRNDRKRTMTTGRTQEIQRLIGRSLRAVTNMEGFGERQIRIDCDVLQADGGTRTAAITGGFVALQLAFQHLQQIGAVESIPLNDHVAAISCGLWQNEAVLDLDYAEDSTAQADANFVLTGDGGIVEIQGTAERDPFSRDQFDALMSLATDGVRRLVKAQKAVLGQ
ncbi:MAG: ribonuclease PH [Pseudomonadota bacterium]|nr:ribonuclease PH [Pseudomonadota bacterium]